jgi:hypothetical protein
MPGIVGAVAGVVLFLLTSGSIAWTLVIPRGRLGVTRYIDRGVDRLYNAVCGRVSSYERRDQIRASQAVVVLGLLLVIWLGTYLVAFGLILWPIEHHLGYALRESGSSMFTLGFASRATTGSSVVDFAAAATGLTVVALQIAYLPTLYGAYNRRETEITLLGTRAGIPAWGPEMLARFHLAGATAEAGRLYETWERWAADLAESHTSYPTLLRFRSPKPFSSWLVGLLAVLDSAALFLAAAPAQAPFQARLCLQMGFTCLRSIGATVHITFDPDPLPDAPLVLSYAEFLVGWDRLIDVGFPVERTPEEAWVHFRGWRVNYERVAYLLAYGIDAVPAAWSGPRRHDHGPIHPQNVVNRTPTSPTEGELPGAPG